MAVIQGRTREQLRQSIGYNLGAMRTSTASSSGTTTTIVDNTLTNGGADRFNGRWLVLQDADSTTNDGIVRRITDSAVSSNVFTLTFMPAAAASTAENDTYEIWEDKYPPQRINDFINQAIIDATGHAYTYKEDISLHGDGRTARLDIPTTLQLINKVEYRASVESKIIHRCDSLFDQTTDNEMSQALDNKDYKIGSSLKITTSSGDGSFITDSITSVNLRGYTHLEGWVKATSALAAADFNICLDNATCTCDGNDKETLPVPAVAADTWTFFRIALANPEDDDAIVSVGIEYNANSGTNTVRFDDLRVVNSDTAIWAKLDKRAWHIDKQGRDLILHNDGRTALGHRLIKLVGGAKPSLLTSDSTTNEIDDQYVITRTTGMALASVGGGASTDADASAQRAAFWFGLAEQAKRSFPILVDARLVE